MHNHLPATYRTYLTTYGTYLKTVPFLRQEICNFLTLLYIKLLNSLIFFILLILSASMVFIILVLLFCLAMTLLLFIMALFFCYRCYWMRLAWFYYFNIKLMSTFFKNYHMTTYYTILLECFAPFSLLNVLRVLRVEGMRSFNDL